MDGRDDGRRCEVLSGAEGVCPGQKESTRWIEGYERAAEMAADMPGTRLVYLADREADMVEMMAGAHEPVRRLTGWCTPNTTVVCLVVTAPSCGPRRRPTRRSAILIAQLDGILARKGDGEPGAKTIWRGLDKVQTADQALRAP